MSPLFKLTAVLLTTTLLTAVLLLTGISRVSAQDTPVAFTGEKTAWYEGFDRYDFLMDEQTFALRPILAKAEETFGATHAPKGSIRCIVVAPKKPAPGNPWSWRGCYWNYEPQTEIELLKRGFYIAFIMCDPDQHWDVWYAILTRKYGLAPRPAFIGMSKGGVNEFAWATTHPDKVSCIYADNPALYPESFTKLGDLASHDVPLLHVYGTYDFLLQHHTLVVEDLYHLYGGRISVMIKETGMTIIMPKKAAQGRPWVFRADRISREAEPVDLALLAKGFTIVAAPVTEQVGPLRKQWDEVYQLLTSQGYSSKPAIEGIGAGGGEAYYWAIGHPDEVSCIYALNPVLRSLQATGPLTDSLAGLAKAGIPILHVCGSRDPWYAGNTVVAKAKYRQLGGHMKVMVKEGAGHFDALTADPAPIVDFIVVDPHAAGSQP